MYLFCDRLIYDLPFQMSIWWTPHFLLSTMTKLCILKTMPLKKDMKNWKKEKKKKKKKKKNQTCTLAMANPKEQAKAFLEGVCKLAHTNTGLDEIVELFTDDGELFVWGPHKKPLKGHGEIREGLGGLASALKGFSVEYISIIGEKDQGSVERMETFEFNQQQVKFNNCGILRLAPDGRIKVWIDYFDPTPLLNAGLAP